MNAFSFITQDWSANRNNTKGRLIGLLFRIANSASRNRAVRLLLTPYLVLYRILVEWTLGTELPYDVVAGPGLKIYHGQALVVHRHTRFGRNCTLRQSTTIGNNGQRGGCPVIGNHVNIGANVCIIGPVTIGDHVQIGAGSVVTKSIPAYSVVVGNPARIIRRSVPESLDLIPELV
ncbi:serine acetyltransferase [Spirosoma sp. KNUC1025]|uniref:serine acetyltransferase n=1 Tax=Spirosoma sp. KNUC1025 TaxID=2894082 RepID=UPI0038655538|nr:serine acetyltransferase [Spirosoma sp. KNUC1025]